MTRIPDGARVIQWGRYSIARKAERHQDEWTSTWTSERNLTTAQLEAVIGIHWPGVSVEVLAYFPPPTLAEKVGNADAFTYRRETDLTPRIAFRRDGGEAWFTSGGTTLTWHRDLTALMHHEAENNLDPINMSTVQPLYPRQP